MNRKLGRCPTCGHALDDAIRAAMGLRNGELLNALCPGRNGPSDIDHVLHNGHHRPEERLMFLEYKNGVPLNDGQRFLFRSLTGDWQERNNGRLLSVRFSVLEQHQADPTEILESIVTWLWPDAQERQAS